MVISADVFRKIVAITLGSRELGYRESTLLAAEDAAAVVAIAYLTLDASGRAEHETAAVVDALASWVGELASSFVAPPELRADDRTTRVEQLRELGAALRATQAGELAYALVYVISIADLELAPAEVEVMNELAIALGLTEDRAAELAALSAQAVTPGVG